MELLTVLMCIGVLIGLLTLALLIWVKIYIQNHFPGYHMLLAEILDRLDQVKKDVTKIKRKL